MFVAVGALLVPAYNLELFGGRFHNDLLVRARLGRLSAPDRLLRGRGSAGLEARPRGGYARRSAYTQRVLSTPVRHARRRVAAVTGTLELRDGTREPVTQELLYGAQERALKLLAAANVCLAAAARAQADVAWPLREEVFELIFAGAVVVVFGSAAAAIFDRISRATLLALTWLVAAAAAVAWVVFALDPTQDLRSQQAA